jgi:hypothetical protein
VLGIPADSLRGVRAPVALGILVDELVELGLGAAQREPLDLAAQKFDVVRGELLVRTSTFEAL